MPHFAIYIENDLARRNERDDNIHAHHDYLREHAEGLLIGGAFLDDAEEFAEGALYVLEAASLEAARQFVDNDPLTRCGSRRVVKVMPWRTAVLGREYVFGTAAAGDPIPGQKPPKSGSA